jgi:hypothetical protein
MLAVKKHSKENSIEESKECNPKYDDNTKDFERRE